jgi:integrase
VALALPPSSALVARSIGSALPAYVTRPQALAIIDAARTTQHRLMIQAFWESGGRVTEVLYLRRCDVDRDGAALVLVNRKQRDAKRRRKVVFVSRALVAQLGALAADRRMRPTDYYFTSQKSDGRPMSRQQCWEIVTSYSREAGVEVEDNGVMRPASGLDFRHGAAIDMLRSLAPFSEVGQQLGHSRPDSTLVYTRLVAPERREFAARRFGEAP